MYSEINIVIIRYIISYNYLQDLNPNRIRVSKCSITAYLFTL